MAEKAEKKPQAAPAAPAPAAEAPAKGGLLSKTPVLLGGAMAIEAAILLGGFAIFRGMGPHPASGAEIAAESAKAADKDKSVEIPVVEFKALNRSSGRTFLYDVSIYAVVKASSEEHVKDTFKDKKALIEDRVRTIIAESDPEKLGGGSEPGLETLRRQIKYQLDTMLGDGVIDEILVPRCIPFRTDY